MCELLGMSANTPTDICFSFSGLLQRGGKTGPHKDGWGIAFYEQKGARVFHDPRASSSSKIAHLIQDYPIKSDIVISHIRKANRGRVCLENTHPFRREMWGREWVFVHNGQLKGIKKYVLDYYQPIGTTDSEHAFCWMLNQIREAFPYKNRSQSKIRELIAKLSQKISELGIFNFLLSDSKYLYCFCSTNLFWIVRKAPFGRAKLVDKELTVDFKAETTPEDIVAIIATNPLTSNEHWYKMKPDELIVFQKGVLL